MIDTRRFFCIIQHNAFFQTTSYYPHRCNPLGHVGCSRRRYGIGDTPISIVRRDVANSIHSIYYKEYLYFSSGDAEITRKKKERFPSSISFPESTDNAPVDNKMIRYSLFFQRLSIFTAKTSNSIVLHIPPLCTQKSTFDSAFILHDYSRADNTHVKMSPKGVATITTLAKYMKVVFEIERITFF